MKKIYILCFLILAEPAFAGLDINSIQGKYGYSYDEDGAVLNGCSKITATMLSKVESCEAGKKSEADCKTGKGSFLSVYKTEKECKKSLEANDI